MSISAAGSVLLPGSSGVNANIMRQGTVDSSANGDGTFQSLITKSDGTKNIATTVNYANGASATRNATIDANGDKTISVTKTNANGKTTTINKTVTVNADGTKSVDKTTDKANGNVVTEDLTYTPAATAGGEATVSGTKTVSNGTSTIQSDQIAGTVTAANGGKDENLTITNQQGQTETLDIDTTHGKGYSTRTASGTNFNGGTIDRWSDRNWQTTRTG